MNDIKPDFGIKAEILLEALPYIKRYQGRTIVIKYGGNAMIDEKLKTAVIKDIVLLAFIGIRVVLVHGGGPEIDAMLKKTGKESRFIKGLRYTDEETMEIVQMVLAGKVNKEIVSLIEYAGGKALGICGIDGALLKAERLTMENEDLGFVGQIREVNGRMLDSILSMNIIPVIATVAMGIGDDEGHSLNINADTAAAEIAVAMEAEKLILMTDVRGIMRDINDESSLINKIGYNELETLKKDGIVNKGMIPKVDCCQRALSGGVAKTHIIDGRIPHSLLAELFTDEGVGTVILKKEKL